MPISVPFHRFSHEAMTTNFDALIVHEDIKYARQAANAAFAEIERCERLLNRHDPGSEIAMINRLKPGEWMRVSSDVLACLEIAAQAFIETRGAFDVSFRSTDKGKRPSAMNFLLLSRPDSPEPEQPSDFLVGIDPEAANHGFESAEIDLGGIGKGYALDLTIPLLVDYSIDNVLLNSGTSTVLAVGAGPGGEGWTVGVSGDYHDMTGFSSTHLLNCALSGSGIAVKGEHIRDPGTGRAAGAIASWVKAPAAAWTDALSTAMMVMTAEAAKAYLQTKTDVSALVIYEDHFHVHGSW